MGVGKGWNSKNRVHTQFFTLTNPGHGVPSNDETKPRPLPPVLFLLFFIILKKNPLFCQEASISSSKTSPHTNTLVWGLLFFQRIL